MRPIKFRGQRIDNLQWIEGYYHYSINWNCHFIKIVKDTPDGIIETDVEVIPETVCQFTGVLDCKGKEIYEGDIFHIGDTNILYQVVWHDSGFMGKQIKARYNYVGLLYWEDRVIVIGNKFENNELALPCQK